jgi:hypothetical protein
MTVLTTSQRAARRAQIRRECLAEAEVNAARRGRSMKCAGWAAVYGPPRHAGELGGCANDGTSCICECHDAPEATP